MTIRSVVTFWTIYTKVDRLVLVHHAIQLNLGINEGGSGHRVVYEVAH